MGCVWSSADLTGEGLRVRIERELAMGGFGQILLASDIDSGDKYAVKKITVTTREDMEKVEKEASMHRLLSDCPFVVPLLADISLDSSVHLVFPFFSHGTLAEMLAERKRTRRYLSLITMTSLLSGVVCALQSLHEKGLAHLDLKAANVLLTADCQPRLTDFGSALRVPISITDSRAHQKWVDYAAENCSMTCRAPELFSCDVGCTIDTPADLWSLGCLVYSLLYLESPFDSVYEKGNSVALAAQSPERIPYPDDVICDDTIRSIAKSLLILQPEKRMALEQIIGLIADKETFRSEDVSTNQNTISA